MGVCVRCDKTVKRVRRGLCNWCYEQARTQGYHIDFPAKTWRNSDLMADWNLLRGEGFTRLQAAQRLGITKSRLEKAIERAGRRGSQVTQ